MKSKPGFIFWRKATDYIKVKKETDILITDNQNIFDSRNWAHKCDN